VGLPAGPGNFSVDSWVAARDLQKPDVIDTRPPEKVEDRLRHTVHRLRRKSREMLSTGWKPRIPVGQQAWHQPLHRGAYGIGRRVACRSFSVITGAP